MKSPTDVKSGLLDPAEVLAGYDVVATLYPSIPPILIWRSWEYAAYRRFELREPVLDVGCGDGRFFRLVFPDISEVIGIDADVGVADAALRSGAYKEVHVCPAHTLPVTGRRFASVFANCSMEHMDRLPEVLAGIHESLEPGGTFLFSVVTDRLIEWSPLPLILRAAGADDLATQVQQDYEAYHHYVNPLPVAEWVRRLEDAGFEIIDRIPILPEWSGRLFLFFDQLWHLKSETSEVGDRLEPYFARRRGFVRGFRQVLADVLELEDDHGTGAGAVFLARRRPLSLQPGAEPLREKIVARDADASPFQVIERQEDDQGRLEVQGAELQARLRALQAQLDSSEQDRAARLRLIDRQGSDLGRLTAAHANLQARLTEVETQLAASEKDRAARLEVIEQQGVELGQREDARMAAERRIAELEPRLAASEEDRAARLAVIERLGAELSTVHRTTGEAEALLRRARQGLVLRLAHALRPAGVARAIERAADLLHAADVSPRGDLSSVAGSEEPFVQGSPAPAEPPADAGPIARIRDPKTTEPFNYTPLVVETIIADLARRGFPVEEIAIDPAAYHDYFAAARYAERYPDYYSFNLPEKSLEHFVAAKLLELGPADVYIDIASEHSPVPEIYAQLFGCVSYRQDLAYPEGLHGDRIGGDAASMPLPDGFATKMALHCSFEHFEGDADIRFVHEIKRVLRAGGRVCFAPLYLTDRYGVLTDPAVAVAEQVSFEPDALVYCRPGWGNRHGRMYDAAHLDSRIRANLAGMRLSLYRIVNATEIDPSCYLQFAAVISRP